MNITRLILKNYRCFKQLNIDFHPQLTVLVANNGGGKTSILDAIAVAFGPYVGSFDEGVNSNFKASDIRLVREFTKENTYSMIPTIEGLHLIAEGYIVSQSKAHTELWKRSLNNTKSKTTTKDAKLLAKYGKDLQEAIQQKTEQKNKVDFILTAPKKMPDSVKFKADNSYLFKQYEVFESDNPLLPLIVYYGTSRLWQLKKLMGNPLGNTSRTIGYTDCLNPASSYKKFLVWFKNWKYCAFQESIDTNKRGELNQRSEFDDYLDSIRNALTTCLEATGWYEIDFDFIKNTIIAIHKDHGTLAVSQLSDGIRTMIGLVADIAFRATKLNGHLGVEAAIKTSGIVLIDEIDMHLHPEWQQIVLQGFTKAFPLIQFIVTTHSPQVLSIVRKENIRVIEAIGEIGDGIYEASIPEFSPLAHRSNDALARIMGVSPAPPWELTEARQQFEWYVRNNQEDTDEARETLQKLNEAGYKFIDSDLSSWRFIANRKKLKGV